MHTWWYTVSFFFCVFETPACQTRAAHTTKEMREFFSAIVCAACSLYRFRFSFIYLVSIDTWLSTKQCICLWGFYPRCFSPKLFLLDYYRILRELSVCHITQQSTTIFDWAKHINRQMRRLRIETVVNPYNSCSNQIQPASTDLLFPCRAGQHHLMSNRFCLESGSFHWVVNRLMSWIEASEERERMGDINAHTHVNNFTRAHDDIKQSTNKAFTMQTKPWY